MGLRGSGISPRAWYNDSAISQHHGDSVDRPRVTVAAPCEPGISDVSASRYLGLAVGLGLAPDSALPREGNIFSDPFDFGLVGTHGPRAARHACGRRRDFAVRTA
jgi:hypothetical protein